MNVVFGPWEAGSPAVLMSAVTGCKLTKLGWNNIETPEHFFPIFLSFLPYFWYLLNIENAICILEFRGLHENIFLYCFIKKWFHILVYHFKNATCIYQIPSGGLGLWSTDNLQQMQFKYCYAYDVADDGIYCWKYAFCDAD